MERRRYFYMHLDITSSLQKLINGERNIVAMLQDCGIHAILTSVRFKPNECILWTGSFASVKYLIDVFIPLFI